MKKLFMMVCFLMIAAQGIAGEDQVLKEKLQNGIKECVRTQQEIAKNIANLNNPDYSGNLNEDQRRIMLESEMARMSQNTIKYNLYVRLLTIRGQDTKMVARLGK